MEIQWSMYYGVGTRGRFPNGRSGRRPVSSWIKVNFSALYNIWNGVLVILLLINQDVYLTMYIWQMHATQSTPRNCVRMENSNCLKILKKFSSLFISLTRWIPSLFIDSSSLILKNKRKPYIEISNIFTWERKRKIMTTESTKPVRLLSVELFGPVHQW